MVIQEKLTALSSKNIQYFGSKIANIRFFKCSAQVLSWSITLLYTTRLEVCQQNFSINPNAIFQMFGELGRIIAIQ